jgi:hypothetical protein
MLAKLFVKLMLGHRWRIIFGVVVEQSQFKLKVAAFSLEK